MVGIQFHKIKYKNNNRFAHNNFQLTAKYEIKYFRILIQNLDAFGNIIHYKYWNQSDEKWLEMYFNIHDTTASELER